MPPKSFSTYLSELTEVTGLGTGDRIPVLESSTTKYVDGGDIGGITALTGDVTASGTGSVAATIANLAVTNAKVATGIDAAKIADGTVSNAEFQYLGNVTSDIQTQLNAKQTLDSDLTTIAGLTPTNDDVMQYKAGAWANRTIAQLKTDLSLSGSNTGDQDLSGLQPLDATLTALAGLTIAANSLTIGTAADTFSQTSFAANTFPARASTGNLVAKTITDFGLSLVDDADASTARTTLGLGTLATQSGTFSGTSSGTNTGDQTISLTGDVTGSGTGSFAATIAANAVTGAKFRQSSGLSVVGNATNITADTADITGTDGQVLRVSGTALGFGTIATAGIANSAVTLPKMADMATASILGRNTAGTGAPEVLSANTTKTLLSLNNVENTALSTWAGTTNITTLGTISTGTWSGTEIGVTKGGTGLTSLGTALQQLRVNAGATALEYFTPSASSGDISNGGNTTGAAITIGTNDAFGLNLETNNVTRLAITGGASTGGAVTITNVTANTNTAQDVLILQTNSTGTAAASFGGGILFQGESSTTDNRDMASLSAIWTTATDASRSSALLYSNVSSAGALTERFRFTASSMTTATSFTIGNSGQSLTIGGSSGLVTLSSTSTASGAITLSNSTQTAAATISIGAGVSYTMTSGTKQMTVLQASFAPTSGTATFAALANILTVNQTGGANGITRGVYDNPTLTAIADYRSFETAVNSSSAKGIYQTGASTVNNFVGSTSFGTTTAPVATALIDMVSTTKGLGLPSMTTTQRDAISSPRAGLLIYNSTTRKLNVYTTAWEAVISA